MDQFVQADDVRARMGLDPTVTDNETVLISAIMAAQFALQDYIGTEFQLTETVVTDTFLLDTSRHNGLVPNDLFRLFCTRGFLLNDANFTIASSPTLLAPVWTTIPAADYLVEWQSGVIKVSVVYSDDYVRVTYKAGYSIDSDPGIPAWLKEGIIAYTPTMINVGGTTGANASGKSTAKAAQDHALLVMSRYVRKRAFVWYPSDSTEA